MSAKRDSWNPHGCSDYDRGWHDGFEDAKAIYDEPFILRALAPGLACIGLLLMLAMLGLLK